MRRLELHPEACREMEESFYWYEAQAPGLGREFLDEVDRGIAHIQERAESWPVFWGEARRYLIHRFPYGLVYTTTEDAIYILAVMHLHRSPGYWADRDA